jgi:UDPglucose--hexose-1-phosphate uridylyltransferase
MSVDEIVLVIRLWQAQLSELGSRWNSVQIFENRGEAMGASNPHPHGQIWANDGVPTFLETESRTQKSYGQQYGKPMLLEVAERESDSGERTVVENEYWIAVVPFWAVWPFETLLLPKFELKRLEHCHEVHVRALAQVLSELLRRYDALFGVPFPYSMGWHVPPYHSDAEYWISHAHFYPPLLRSASVRKFMVGYELLAESQRDLTPEKAAARLREVTLGQ